MNNNSKLQSLTDPGNSNKLNIKEVVENMRSDNKNSSNFPTPDQLELA